MQLLIYTDKITSRKEYAFKIIFEIILGLKYQLTCNKDEFINSVLPKLNYSQHPVADELFIESHSLLNESNTNPVITNVSEYLNCKIFFKTGTKSALPFDIFAAGFYLVTRYEEYQPVRPDNFKRFRASDSIAYKNNFLDEPIVNIWAKMLANLISERHPELEFPKKKFRFISTIDIDNAYAFLNKSFFRSFASTLRSFIKLDFPLIIDRFAVLSGKRKDPYDTYDYLEEIHDKYKIEPVFFFLLGRYSRYDKNISPDNLQMQKLIKRIATKYQVGIHPSYASNRDKKILEKEIEKLKLITGKPVIKSRQHFLRLSLPDTYNNLTALGIKEDYTMGYASQPGFRAGICNPYPFYDLQNERETGLMIYPFQVMETTFKEYLNMSPFEAGNEISDLIKKVKKADGTFISLWHNESLNEKWNRQGWRMVFEKMLDFVI